MKCVNCKCELEGTAIGNAICKECVPIMVQKDLQGKQPNGMFQVLERAPQSFEKEDRFQQKLMFISLCFIGIAILCVLILGVAMIAGAI